MLSDQRFPRGQAHAAAHQPLPRAQGERAANTNPNASPKPPPWLGGAPAGRDELAQPGLCWAGLARADSPPPQPLAAARPWAGLCKRLVLEQQPPHLRRSRPCPRPAASAGEAGGGGGSAIEQVLSPARGGGVPPRSAAPAAWPRRLWGGQQPPPPQQRSAELPGSGSGSGRLRRPSGPPARPPESGGPPARPGPARHHVGRAAPPARLARLQGG